jgi:hypothetical protein
VTSAASPRARHPGRRAAAARRDGKRELDPDVRPRLGQVAADLERTCGHLVLDFPRDIQFKTTERAALVPDEINRRFPIEAPRCHNVAAEKAIEHGP